MRHYPRSDKRAPRICPICESAGRPLRDHYLSQCSYLPPSDLKCMSRARQAIAMEDPDNEDIDGNIPETDMNLEFQKTATRRVSTKKSPQIKVFHNGYPLRIT